MPTWGSDDKCLDSTITTHRLKNTSTKDHTQIERKTPMKSKTTHISIHICNNIHFTTVSVNRNVAIANVSSTRVHLDKRCSLLRHFNLNQHEVNNLLLIPVVSIRHFKLKHNPGSGIDLQIDPLSQNEISCKPYFLWLKAPTDLKHPQIIQFMNVLDNRRLYCCRILLPTFLAQ